MVFHCLSTKVFKMQWKYKRFLHPRLQNNVKLWFQQPKLQKRYKPIGSSLGIDQSCKNECKTNAFRTYGSKNTQTLSASAPKVPSLGFSPEPKPARQWCVRRPKNYESHCIGVFAKCAPNGSKMMRKQS